MEFSANLGFLWQDKGLVDAIHLAHAGGFAAVECHWPFAVPSEQVRQALRETGLTMMSLNTAPGVLSQGEFGLAACPGREDAARAAIDQAIGYAQEIGALAVHVMAGKASGPQARACFLRNLSYASFAAQDIDILIEPINSHDVPGYFLTSIGEALDLIRDVGRPNVKLLFDCYHVARMGGDVCAELTVGYSVLGHVQCASVPGRGAPDGGDLDYQAVFTHLTRLGWARPIGAEFIEQPVQTSHHDWMSVFKKIS